VFEIFCRLPIFIRPISYDLELTPNITTLAVRGIIKLIFQVRFPLPTTQNRYTNVLYLSVFLNIGDGGDEFHHLPF
jgi:hypothetical protein